MKKHYFYLFSLLMAMMCSLSISAQEPIAKLSELSNAKAYTISSSRATLQVIDGGSCLYSSTGTAEGITDLDASKPNHQFAIINGGKNYFLYSVGAGKFIDKTGAYTDELSEDVTINVVETASEFFPFNLNWDATHYLNTQVLNQTATGYVIDSWNTLDAGNQFSLIPVADFADEAAIKKAQEYDSSIITDTINYVYMYNGEEVYSYTLVYKGVAPLTITYDGPGTRVGATCTDETPASREITESTTETVVYNYTMDASVLPFVPTTIVDDQFAEGTKWYYLQPSNSNNFCYTTDEANKMYYANKKGVHPIDLHYMFAFVGNPLTGFQIYNYSKGATMKVYGDNSSSYGSVAFNVNSKCKYFLEEGTSEGQYRFNQSPNPNSYLHAYASEIEVYTWGDGWASDDSGSQFYIAAVADKEIEQAIAGVLTHYSSVEDGTTFRGGSAMSLVQIYFEGQNEETIAIAEGKETNQITLVDSEGNVVATPTYMVNPNDSHWLDISFDPEFNKEGSYKLIIPDGLVYGVQSMLPNTQIELRYTFLSEFEAKTVTARVYKSFAYGDYTYTNFSGLPYETHVDGDYYTIKVKVEGQDKFTLIDWEGTGDETHTLAIEFDNTLTYGNGKTINGTEKDSYESVWVTTSTIHDTGYSGAYFYLDDYSSFEMDNEYGCMILPFYSWDSSSWQYYSAEWYMDDRYALQDILPGKVYNSAFTDLYYDDVTYPAFSQLPYTAEGTYDISVGIIDDNTIVLQNYTGVEGENLTIVFEPETGNVTSFNGLAVDEEGSSWIESTVLDGKSGGWYAYVGDYSNVSYNKDTKSGWAIISGYDSSTQTYPFIYVAFGDYTPTTNDIHTLTAQSAKNAIYNLAGQRLNTSPTRGIYIINGKKVAK